MSFREKSAWVTLITLILLTILFFMHFPQPWTLAPESSGLLFHVTMLLIASFVIIEIVAHIALAVWSPKDARAPKDERERLIALKSTAVGAYVYAFLSLSSVFVTLHLVGGNVIGLGYLIFGSLVLAEIVKYALRVYFYRRGF